MPPRRPPSPPPPVTFWQGVFYGLAVLIVVVILARLALGLTLPAGITETLIFLAAALLGVGAIFRGNGR